MSLFHQKNRVIKVITYQGEEDHKSYCCFVYEDGTVDIFSDRNATIHLQQFLKEIGYTTDNLQDIYNDPLFELHKSEREKQEILKEIQENRKKKNPLHHIKNVVITPFFDHTRDFVLKYKKETAFSFAALLTGIFVISGIKLFSDSSNEEKADQPQVTTVTTLEENTTEQEENTTEIEETVNSSFFSPLQSDFVSHMREYQNIVTRFNQQHREENVVFEDGHTVSFVEFSYHPLEASSAFILGASFTPQQYRMFMNNTHINLEEYQKYYEAWYRNTHYQYLIRQSEEDTGILALLPSDSKGYEVLQKIDHLHKSLVAAQKEKDIPTQKKIVNQLYQIKNDLFKIKRAATLESTDKNFQSLELPSYVLLTLPIFDAVKEQYRNVLMDDGKTFSNDLDEKVFTKEGIYSNLYIDVMKNISSVEETTEDLSYARFDQVMESLVTSSWSENEHYAVQNLRAVKEALEHPISFEQKEDSTSSTTKKTKTKVTTETKNFQKTVQENQLTEQEKASSQDQKDKISNDLENKTNKNKQQAEQKALEQAKKDQLEENQKKEALKKEAEEANRKKEQEIQSMKPGQAADGVHPNSGVNEQYVKDPTVDGAGSYQDFPDLNGDGSNVPKEPSQNSSSKSPQADTIIEGEEPIPTNILKDVMIEKIATSEVEKMANQGEDSKGFVYQK